MTGGMTECAAKMQKSPAFQAGDELFRKFFAWCSSIGSHMGEQTDITGRFQFCGHKNAPSHGKCNSIIP